MDGAPLEHIALEKDFDEAWGDQPFGAPMPRAFRLSDAERIAAHRLDGAAEGSLKEALATKIVDAVDDTARLGDRLLKVAESTVAPVIAPPAAIPDMAAGDADFGWFGAVPPAHAVPCFEERDPDVDLAAAFAPPPVTVAAPMPTPLHVSVAPIAPSRDEAPAEALPGPAVEMQAADAPSAHSPMSQPIAEEHPLPPLMALPEDPNLEPIVTAYAASARLAADAAAASQALFELQRLLNQQMLEASPELSGAMEAHGLAGLEAIPVAQQPTSEAAIPLTQPRAEDLAIDPATDASLAPPRVVQQAAPPPQRPAATPPPLPVAAHVPPPEMSPAPGPLDTTAPPQPAPHPPAIVLAVPPPAPDARPRMAPSRLPAGKPQQPRRERPRAAQPRAARKTRSTSTFDVRGFAAGFVLSGAIGVVLYFVMATS